MEMTHRTFAVELKNIRFLGERRKLMPLPIAAAIAYATIIGAPTNVKSPSLLQERLNRIALALSAVATIFSSCDEETAVVSSLVASDVRALRLDDFAIRTQDLFPAIDILQRSGLMFSDPQGGSSRPWRCA